MTVNCFMCGKEFEVEAEKAREWAESGRPFDPTDWECPDCLDALDRYYEGIHED